MGVDCTPGLEYSRGGQHVPESEFHEIAFYLTPRSIVHDVASHG